MFGNYSKFVGALVGNAVAIIAIYLATMFPSVATCTLGPDGEQSCIILGFSQADLTMAVMAVINSAFVYFFPPNKETMRSLALVGVLVMTTVALSACSLSLEQQTAVAKAYDKTCAMEPAVYQSFVTIAVAKQASQKTLDKAAAIHASFTNDAGTGLCQTRPMDLASASVQLAALYAQLVTISAQVERS